ncbi:S8 family serine peptidase [bacterium]|nr:S8 family serine peptidase [bacterium]
MTLSSVRVRFLLVCGFLCLALSLFGFVRAFAQSDDPPTPAVDAAATDATWATWDGLSAQVQAKVDPRLLAEFRGEVAPAHLASMLESPAQRSGAVIQPTVMQHTEAQPIAQTRFLVILHEQPHVDVPAQGVYASAAEQRNAVVNELAAHAQRSQSSLRTLLDARRQVGAVTGYQPFTIVNAIAVDGDLSTLTTLAQRADVTRIVANYPLVRIDNDLPASPDEAPAARQAPAAQTEEYPWNIPFTGVNRVWLELGVRGEGAVVGGFDTGVVYDHPALVSAYRGYVNAITFDHNYNWFEPDGKLYPNGNLGPSASDEPYDCDYQTHGTHTMGTMIGDGGTQARAIGMAPGARWIAVPGICGNTMPGVGIADDIGGLKAFQWFLCPTDLSGDLATADCSKAPDVINNSWGSANPVGTLFQPALQALRAAGTSVVFAAGNTGRAAGIGSPAHLPEALTVGAIDYRANIAYFSSQGPSFSDLELKPNLSAPGVDVLSSVSSLYYGSGSGTSMASPHVAGLVALLVSADLKDGFRDFTVDEIEQFILSTVVDGGDPGPDYLFGQGYIDAFRSVRWATSAGELTGVIADAQSRAPISGVEIYGVNITTSDVFTVTTDSQGGFSLSVPAGRYNLALHHLLYESTVATNQPVVTGALLTSNFQMTAKPRAPLTGVVRSANVAVAGASVYLKTTTPVQTTSGADGSFRLNVPAGRYTLVVEARGHKHFEREVTVSAHGAVVDYTLTTAPTILLVNADASAGWFYGWPVHPFVEWALQQNGYLYDLWEIQYTDFFDTAELVDGTQASGVPSVTTLRNYDVVLWMHSGCSGYAYYHGCTWGTPAKVNADGVLAEYLDSGGRLLISGQDIGRSDGDLGFYDHYLKADLQYDFGAYENATLDALYFLDGLSLEVTNASQYGSPNSVSELSPDAVATSGGAFPILEYAYIGEPAALAVAPCNEDYRAIYFAMGYENVAPRGDLRSDDMSALVARSIEWLVGADTVTLYHLNSMVTAQSGAAGSRQSYAIVLENNSAHPLTISVALSGAQWPASLSGDNGPLGDSVVVDACDRQQLLLSVQIPTDAPLGATDTVTLTSVAPEASIPRQQQAFVTSALPQWQRAAPMPTGRHAASVATVNGDVYVAGGRSIDPGYLTSLVRYEPCADVWATLAPMPEPLAYAVAGAIGRRIYVAGGLSGTAYSFLDKLWIYDVDSNTWREGASLPLKLIGSAAAVWRDRLYVFGGLSEYDYHPALLYYDTTLEQWINAGEVPFPGYIYSLSAATWNDEIYLVQTGDPWQEMFIFNPAEGTWRSASAHDIARYGASLVAEGDYLYLVGGQYDTSSATERYDPRQDRWIRLADLQSINRLYAGVAASTDRLIVFGGEYGVQETEVLSLRPNYCDSSARSFPQVTGVGATFDVAIHLKTGVGPIENSQFTAPLPVDVTFEGFYENPVGAIYNAAGHAVEWQGSLPVNGSNTVVFTLRSSADTPPDTWHTGEVIFSGVGYKFTRGWRTLVLQADFSPSVKKAGAFTIIDGERMTYTISLNGRTPIGGSLRLTDTLPNALTMIPASLSATLGEIVFEPAQNLLTWRGVLSNRLTAFLNTTATYQWGDSKGEGDVTDVAFEWEEISSTGKILLSGDSGQICDVAVGFDFPFFGELHSTLCVDTNGFVTVGGVYQGSYLSCPFPNGSSTGIIAGYAMDLVVEDGVYAQTVGESPNRRLILQWKDAHRFGYDPSPSVDFQIVLFESGNIDFRILRTPAMRNSYTVIGVQATGGAQGVTYSCGNRPLENGLAVKFLAPGQSSGGPSAQLSYAVSLVPGTDANRVLTNTAVLETPAGPLTRTAGVLANPIYMDRSTATADVAEVLVAQPFNYQFELRNTGRVTATRAELRNTLPPQLTYLPGTLTCSAGACTVADNRVTWQGTVAPGEGVTLAYSATVGIDVPDQTVVTNTAQIDDGYGGITEITATVRARQAELAGSYVEFDPPIVHPGDMVTYTIYLRNSGGADVGVDAYHQLPLGVIYMPGSLWCGTGICDMQGDTIYWRGSLSRRVMVPVRIRAQLAPWLTEGSSVMGFLILQRHDRPEPYTLSTYLLLAQRSFLSIIANPNWRLFFPETYKTETLEVIILPTPIAQPVPTPIPTSIASPLPTPVP